jgi:hypothetical protein
MNETTKGRASLATTIPIWLALFVTIGIQLFTAQQQTNRELLEHRRIALFSALRVIDLTYSNESLPGQTPNLHPWNIQTARDADNELRIYCKYPETINAFRKALGIYNPSTGQKPLGIDIKSLDDFRVQVAKELDLNNPIGLDANLAWISGLAGATEPPPGETKSK